MIYRLLNVLDYALNEYWWQMFDFELSDNELINLVNNLLPRRSVRNA